MVDSRGEEINRQKLASVERRLLAEELLSYLRHAVSNKLGSIRNAAFTSSRVSVLRA